MVNNNKLKQMIWNNLTVNNNVLVNKIKDKANNIKKLSNRKSNIAEKSDADDFSFLNKFRYNGSNDSNDSNVSISSSEMKRKLLIAQKNINSSNNAPILTEPIKIGLKDSYLKYLIENEDIFAIKDDILYNVGLPTNNKSNILKYNGRNFELREGENIKNLEKIFYNNNAQLIEKSRDKIIKKLEGEERKINGMMPSQLDNRNPKELLIESILKYYHESNLKIPKSNIQNDKIDFNSIDKLDFSNITSIFPNYLNKYNKDVNTLLGFFGNIYLTKTNNLLNIDIGNIDKYINISDRDKFELGYMSNLEEIVNNKLNNQFNGLNNRLKSQKSLNENIKIKINKKDVLKLREENGNHIFYEELPEFIILRGGGYFKFNSANLAVLTNIGNDKIKINVPGFIYGNNSYYHPFSMGSRDHGTAICHGRFTGWVERGIKQEWQNINQNSILDISNQVHEVIGKLKQVITRGCNSDFTPGIYFNGFDQVKISKTEAHKLNTERGIKIYDNK